MTPTSPIDLSQRVNNIKPSPTIAIATRADELIAEGKPIVNLSIGEPDFDTPQFIKDAAVKALQQGHTKYTAVDGIKALKQAIIDKFKHDNQLQYQLNQILVSTGAKQSLYNLFTCLLQPQDEVIIPAPYWVSYPDMVILAEGKPVIVETQFSEHFKLTPEALAKAITPRTRLLILNTPSNPTGIAYSKAELKALGEVLLQHPHVFIASDDIYEKMLWQHLPFSNILNACPELYDRTVVVNGVSKTYAMTGWRIGYAAGPAALIGAMKKAQSQMTSNPTSIAQYAALAALIGDQSCVVEMCKAYKERHDYVIKELQTMPGVKCIPSDGTFYAFPNIAGLLNQTKGIKNDLDLAEYLLAKAEIAIVPGSAFGTPGHIRICFTTSMDKLKEGMQRLRKVAEELVS